MEQFVLNSSLNTQQKSQNTTTETKFYIDRTTGEITNSIDPNEIANYIETDSKQVLYIDIKKEFSDGNNAVSTTPVMGGKVMSVLQYEQYKKISKAFVERYSDPITTKEEKNRMMKEAMNKIVDSKVIFPADTENHDIKRLQIASFITAVGKEVFHTPNSSQTQKPIDDTESQRDALMKKLYSEESTVNSSTSEASEQNNNAVKGFFKMKIHRKDTGLFWWPRSVGNTTQIINDKEYQGPTMMLSGNGFSFKRARSNVLLNKMITKLEGNDPDVVMTELFGFTTRGFGMGRRFLHKKNFINTLKDPKKFEARFQAKLTEYVAHRLRNLSQNEKQAIIQAIINAKNAFLQQHINQVQSIMTDSDLSSLARQYNPN